MQDLKRASVPLKNREGRIPIRYAVIDWSSNALDISLAKKASGEFWALVKTMHFI